jgi:cytochrome b pre-mRNA-processing protein 3
MMNPFARSGQRKRLARRLCAEMSAQARAPAFFQDLGVEDSIDGRFDLVALHAWLLLERLSASEPALSQALMNEIFLQFDEALRELGVGDMGISRRAKKMAGAFFGRLKAYRAAANSADLADAIQRNLYRGDPRRATEARALAGYARQARTALLHMPSLEAKLDFGAVPSLMIGGVPS